MENEKQYHKYDVQIQITEIYSKFLRQYQLTSEAITYICHSLDNFNELYAPPLQTDAFPIAIIDPKAELKPELRKERILLWLFKKGFEEFIVGLSQTLIEAYKCAKIYDLSVDSWANKGKYSPEIIQSEIEKISKKSLDLPFPQLIADFEKAIKEEVKLKEEVLSINKARTCLVHRNGVVMDKDINDDLTNSLKISFLELTAYFEKNGETKKLTYEIRKNGLLTDKLFLKPEPKSILFKKGASIMIDENIFNGVAYTCISFAKNLYDIITVKCNMPVQKMEIRLL